MTLCSTVWLLCNVACACVPRMGHANHAGKVAYPALLADDIRT